jgi:hypothetical protein
MLIYFIYSSKKVVVAAACGSTNFYLFVFNRGGHLTIKVKTIENVVKGYTQLNRVGGEGLGLHLLDQDIRKYGKFPTGKEKVF